VPTEVQGTNNDVIGTLRIPCRQPNRHIDVLPRLHPAVADDHRHHAHAIGRTTDGRCYIAADRRLLEVEGYTAINAASSAAGSDFPRLLARRRMPTHALCERKNFGGIASTGSSSEDKDTHSPLGRSEVLQVKHAECGHGITSRNHTTAASPTVCWNSDGGTHDG
jgi:hypothetical protein